MRACVRVSSTRAAFRRQCAPEPNSNQEQECRFGNHPRASPLRHRTCHVQQSVSEQRVRRWTICESTRGRKGIPLSTRSRRSDTHRHSLVILLPLAHSTAHQHSPALTSVLSHKITLAAHSSACPPSLLARVSSVLASTGTSQPPRRAAACPRCPICALDTSRSSCAYLYMAYCNAPLGRWRHVRTVCTCLRPSACSGYTRRGFVTR